MRGKQADVPEFNLCFLNVSHSTFMMNSSLQFVIMKAQMTLHHLLNKDCSEGSSRLCRSGNRSHSYNFVRHQTFYFQFQTQNSGLKAAPADTSTCRP